MSPLQSNKLPPMFTPSTKSVKFPSSVKNTPDSEKRPSPKKKFSITPITIPVKETEELPTAWKTPHAHANDTSTNKQQQSAGATPRPVVNRFRPKVPSTPTAESEPVDSTPKQRRFSAGRAVHRIAQGSNTKVASRASFLSKKKPTFSSSSSSE